MRQGTQISGNFLTRAAHQVQAGELSAGVLLASAIADRTIRQQVAHAIGVQPSQLHHIAQSGNLRPKQQKALIDYILG